MNTTNKTMNVKVDEVENDEGGTDVTYERRPVPLDEEALEAFAQAEKAGEAFEKHTRTIGVIDIDRAPTAEEFAAFKKAYAAEAAKLAENVPVPAETLSDPKASS